MLTVFVKSSAMVLLTRCQIQPEDSLEYQEMVLPCRLIVLPRSMQPLREAGGERVGDVVARLDGLIGGLEDLLKIDVSVSQWRSRLMPVI